LTSSSFFNNSHDFLYRIPAINIDCATRGLGSASCGPGPRPEFIIKPDSAYSYAFRISPAGK
jgi:hypothetical protein